MEGRESWTTHVGVSGWNLGSDVPSQAAAVVWAKRSRSILRLSPNGVLRLTRKAAGRLATPSPHRVQANLGAGVRRVR